MVRVCRVVPKDWSKFQPVGNVIPRTRFIVFKTPINSQLSTKIHKEQRFTTNDLFRQLSERGQYLGLVVDLSDTDRYYDKKDITGMCVQYEKVNCPGRGFIERDDCVESFHQVIQDYTDKCDDPDALIGVHCTNGINRCGYLICRFLIDRLGWSSHEAIDAFEQARGYSIEKGAYVMALHKAAKDKRDKQVDSDSDSSERQRKKKNKRKHREIVEHENIVLINTIIGELGSQAASVSGTDYQNSPNGVSVDPGQPQPHHWGFAIKRSKYAQLNQPVANGANTPPEPSEGTPQEEEEFEEDFEEIEEETETEPGKGQSVSSKRRARRNRMQKYMQVMQRGRFHEIQAIREEVALSHGSARD
ncbi:putative tyrosine-protein phosphatase pir-2 [Caenorhabditis elegans]|uniref:Probable tyrosine-protein phosphatase pir-2 n=2 Tax=Caenorhabditis elegans TaxID=6239 RepID=PTP5_CAEEL|nr:putative tyrosine-protein phosphatase F54C8.4 [Caenorhabditis elegans]P34442.1 RecName: Full=Probable tyrosine-protein phosphatase F54C8.4 [Caenorhabditis elegans]CAA80156.1 Probable tyrosine-protein phosphatase F54C8.4 [Caenorhabditis elegans]|eukprot:NP_001254988.1 Probable tyrosine-protein phosphatase F54C8.4 [Caenorhabditis elegans]